MTTGQLRMVLHGQKLVSGNDLITEDQSAMGEVQGNIPIRDAPDFPRRNGNIATLQRGLDQPYRLGDLLRNLTDLGRAKGRPFANSLIKIMCCMR